MKFLKKTTVVITLLASSFILNACATQPEADPLESMNRGIYKFNEVVDKAIIGPVAKGYRYITPDFLRSRIGNFSDNLREPLTFINAVFQGDVQHSLTSFWRFVLNSTIGIFGIHDVASDMGLPERREDFGQTLGSWGSGSGPYIVLPILGPSNGRDVLGKVADWFLDPFHYYLEEDDQYWMAAGQGLVERERLIETFDDVYETSLDPYVTWRSMYTQHREAQIKNSRGRLEAYDDEVEEKKTK